MNNVCSQTWSNAPMSCPLSWYIYIKSSPSCSYYDNNDCATCSRVLLRSSVNKGGIHQAHNFKYWRCCLMIVFTLPSLMFSIPDNSQKVIRLFSWISTSTRSVFSHVIEVLGQRSWGSFSTIFLPFLNAMHHLQTLTFDSVFSPYSLVNLEQISDGLQPSFVRNLIICAVPR